MVNDCKTQSIEIVGAANSGAQRPDHDDRRDESRHRAPSVQKP
jgi:hypothetical protein